MRAVDPLLNLPEQLRGYVFALFGCLLRFVQSIGIIVCILILRWLAGLRHGFCSLFGLLLCTCLRAGSFVSLSALSLAAFSVGSLRPLELVASVCGCWVSIFVFFLLVGWTR